MKIYFAAAISAGRDYAEVYRKIVDDLKASGHQVLTEHVADPEVLKKEKNVSPEDVYLRDIDLLRQCDVLLAEISKPSTGVGYEIGMALHALRKPVVCVYLKGLRMTKMITGNTDPLLRVFAYESVNELLDALPLLLEESQQKVCTVGIKASKER
jgi:nucleoside 2-deoxyribosyltransferase